MGHDLLVDDLFRDRLQACDAALCPFLDWSPAEVLREAPGGPPFERLDVSQPLLFAVSVALTSLWRAAGFEPDAVLGHSVGEIAAAACCGALPLEDAARVAATWGHSSMRMEGAGQMVSLPLPVEMTEERISRWGGRLWVAASNAPTWTAVSGEDEAAEELLGELAEDGIHGHPLGIPAPGHSPLMEPVDAWFREELAQIAPSASEVPFYSAVSGGRIDTTDLDARYWSANLRQPVLFEAAVRALLRDGFNVFIEIGPRPVLTSALEEIVGEGDALVLGTLEEATAGSFLGPARAGVEQSDLLELVLEEVAKARDLAPAAIDPDRPFKELGFDSAAAVELRNVLNRIAGLALPATLAFDHPTPRRVAEKMRLELGADDREPARSEGAPLDDLALSALVELVLEEDEREPGRD